MVATRGNVVSGSPGGGSTATPRLRFKDRLAGPSDALQRKLKTLFEELSHLEQGNVDIASLNTVRKDLISPTIMLHKDKGVKAHAACCMADLLRLYAPDAPYTAGELRDMFQFFFKQISTGLRPDSPYYHQYFALIESLSTVKSIVLVCDLPNAEELISMLFREFFALVKSGDLGRNVELYMSDILVAVIEESHALPGDVVNAIIAQFQPNAPAPAHRLASVVCTSTADRLQRYVCQYFMDVITQNSASTAMDEDNDDDDDETSPAPIDQGAVRAAHTLIYNMSVSAPALLHNVIPQLEAELRTEELALRSLATTTLGQIFSNAKTGMEFVRKYPSCWKAWTQRKVDKNATVRMEWVESTRLFIGGAVEVKADIDEGISQKFMDPDERVRAAACRMFGELDYEILLTHASSKHLRLVGERTKDKKVGPTISKVIALLIRESKNVVRVDAMTTLGKIWSLAWPDINARDATIIDRFSWIPTILFHAVSHNTEAKQTAEDVISNYILPLPTKDALDDDAAWTDRLLTTWRYLDEKAITNLFGMTPIRTARPTVYEHFLQACVDNNGGTIDANEEAIKRKLSLTIQALSQLYPDPHKAGEDLSAFAKDNDSRCFKLLRTCMDPVVDVKALTKASSEFLKRVGQSHNTTLTTLTSLLLRTSFCIINTSTIKVLLRLLLSQQKDPSDIVQGDFAAACRILTFVTKHCPVMLEGQVVELTKLLTVEEQREEDEDEKESGDMIAELALGALGGIARRSKAEASTNEARATTAPELRAQKLAKSFVLGNHARQAKFAARILAYAKNPKDLCTEVVESIASALPDLEDDLKIEAHIAALAEIVKVVPEAFEAKSEALVSYMLKEVLMKIIEVDGATVDVPDDEAWLEDEDVPPLLRARIQSLKVCKNRCLSQAESPSALDLASPVLKMLLSYLENNGDFSADKKESGGIRSRMRLQASSCLLSLSTIEVYRRAIGAHFVDLALTVQDQAFNVRFAFVQKVIYGLQHHKLDRMFNVMLFLSISDPEPDNSERVKNYVTYALRRFSNEAKIASFETTFIRLLHLLAHHPDFDTNVEDLKVFPEYLNFYFDLIATEDNLPLLYHLAMKAKTVRDAQAQEFSERLYIIGEIAQEMIKARARAHSWSLPSYPGKVKLPADIFKALPSQEATAKILKHTYMPAAFSAWLAQESAKPAKQVKARTKAEAVEGDDPEAEVEAVVPKKRKGRPPANGDSAPKRKRGRPRKYRQESGDEDEEKPTVPDGSDEEEVMTKTTSKSRRQVKQESPPPPSIASDSEKEDQEDTPSKRRTRAKNRVTSGRTNGKQKK